MTTIGMAGGPEADELAFAPEAARAAGRQVVSGTEVAALQAAEQFERYTGVRPTPEQVAEASGISRP